MSRIRSPTPEPPPEDDADEADDVSTEEGGMNGIEGPEKKKPKIYHLPPCTPLNVDENGVEKRTRIPDQPPPQISEDLDLSQVLICFALLESSLMPIMSAKLKMF